MVQLLTRFAKDPSGATAIEYGLIAALIVVCVFLGMSATGVSLGDLYRATFDLIVAAISN